MPFTKQIMYCMWLVQVIYFENNEHIKKKKKSRFLNCTFTEKRCNYFLLCFHMLVITNNESMSSVNFYELVLKHLIPMCGTVVVHEKTNSILNEKIKMLFNRGRSWE